MEGSMTGNKVIEKLLRMKGFRVTWFSIHERKKEISVGVKPHKTGCRCPLCNRRGIIVPVAQDVREWRDVIMCGMKVTFYYSPKEIICATHGRIQEVIPWADAYARVTYRFEYLMLMFAQMMTQKAASQLLHIPKSTFSDLLHRAIQRLRAGHRIRNLKSVGIDEISYCKGKKYATVVYDLDRHCVVWIGRGKGRETIDEFFLEKLSKHQRAGIKRASCDMSQTYIGAIEDHCPNAVLVLDHFHITKALGAAMDEVRKEEWRLADKPGKEAPKGMRWLLFMHSSNRTKKDTRLINQLKKSNHRIHRAWVLKDEFAQFWEYVSPKSAENFLRAWMTAALKSRIQPIKDFAATLRKHLPYVLAYTGTRISNAVAEGLNRVIRIVKNRASGFQSLDAFSELIYLVVGDVDIPEQIPSRFRTL